MPEDKTPYLEKGPVVDSQALTSLPEQSTSFRDTVPTGHKSSSREDTGEQECVKATPTSRENIPNGDFVSDHRNEQSTRRKRTIQFITLCWVFIQEGWNDSSLGPLLPSIQEYYKVNYTVVSLIFFFLCVGFILGAVLNVYMSHRFGFGKTIVVGTLGQISAYAIIVVAPPFPVTVFAYTLYGVSTMMQNAQVNSFVAGLNDSSKMAVLHAVYGTGAFISPFVSTMFATKNGWHIYYFTTLGLSISVALSLSFVFRLKTREEAYASCGIPVQVRIVTQNEHNIYRQLGGVRVAYPLSLFALAYVGLEITIGGWTVTYLVHRTGAGPSAGFISSGFFAGIALGRILLLCVGERRVIFLYAVVALVLEVVIWEVPKFIPSAILISFIGLFLGPMFPILMNQCGNFFPSHLLSGGIGCIVGFGTLGGALLPFATGALADRYGVTSMQPLIIAVIVFMILMWAGVVYGSRNEAQPQSSTLPA